VGDDGLAWHGRSGSIAINSKGNSKGRHRFVLPGAFSSSGEEVELSAEESHHLTYVLRLREGAQVQVFDGAGQEWRGEVAQASPRRARLRLLAPLTHPVDSPLALTLALALLKGEKFDWVLQKATELGVSRIVPLITEHCEWRRGEGGTTARAARWERITLEAAKQCGRRTFVDLSPPTLLADFCASRAGESCATLLLSERGGLAWQETAARLGQVPCLSVVIGPEGGWSDAEHRLTKEAGFHHLHLGPRILRAETAAISAVALAQLLFGDLAVPPRFSDSPSQDGS